MGFPLTLIDLAGTIALLLWAVRMVQTGIQRAFGPRLRPIMAAMLRGRARAFLAGVGITAILQSSTATGLMLSGFAAAGFVDLVPALAVMLGANVGSTLIVQVISFNISGLTPCLFLIGLAMFRRGNAAVTRDLGRTAIGLGLMLLSLRQLLDLVTPFEDVPNLRLLLGAVATEPVLDLLLGALAAWAAHSSVAVVLLVMSFAAKGVIPLHAAFALVLGANLGTALNPVLEGTHGGDPAARRVPLGNLIARAAGAGLALAVLSSVGPWLVRLVPDDARAVADFHSLFNLALAAILMPLLRPYAALLRLMLPARVDQADPARPIYLASHAREVPSVALGGAAREALRMADVLEAMLQRVRDGFDKPDRRLIAETRRMDDVLDRLNAAIKAYLGSLDAESLTEADHQRAEEILLFAHNLEHAGDIVDKNLMSLASKRLKRGMVFDAGAQAQLSQSMNRLTSNLHAAAAVFMTDDGRAARLLAEEKEVFRDMEDAATREHFARLRRGNTEQAETRALHLDVLRDLKQVNAHLVAAAAYPVLKGQGDLLPSRLRAEG